MFPAALLLLLAAGSSVKCEQLTQPDSVTVQPGQHLTITCQVSYSMTSYYTAWIRQLQKGLEWMGYSCAGCTPVYKDSLKNKFSISVDSSSNTVTLNGQNLQPEDSAVYYCARDYYGAFDYWGKGTTVTVSSATSTAPTVFPLVPCGSGTGDKVTLACLATGFTPSTLTFSWTKDGTVLTDFIQYPPVLKNDVYTGISQIQVNKADWTSENPLKCSVTHVGGDANGVLLPPSRNIVPPNITLYPVWDDDDGASSVKLICTLSGYFPDTLEVQWKKEDATLDHGEQTQTKLQTVNSKGFTLSSEIKPKKGEWEKGTKYTCKSTHMETTFNKTISICNFHWRTRPSVQVEIPSFNTVMMAKSEVEATCVVKFDLKPKVTWLKDGVEASNTKIENKDNGTHMVSKLKVLSSEWKQLKSVTCKAVDQCSSTAEKTVNIEKKNIVSPSITLYPVWDGDNGASSVKLICTLSGYFPDTLEVQWKKGDDPLDSQEQTQRKLQSVAPEETYSLSSEIKPNNKHWEGGTKYTCKSTHNNKEFTKTISICKVRGRSLPSVEVEIPSFKTVMTSSEVEAVCVVQSAYKAKVTWLKDANKAPATQTESNAMPIVSKLKVSSSDWKQLRSVTCRAEHPCFQTTEKSVNVKGVVTRPSVEIRRSLTGLEQGDLVLLCNVTGLSSTDLYITFQDNKGETSDQLYVYLPEAPGLHSVTREWSVNALSGMKDRSFTCTVTQDFTGGVKSNSISFDAEPSVDVSAGEESDPQRLVCSGSGVSPQIQWLCGSEKVTSKTTSSISMGADGRVTVSSQLPVPENEWKTGRSFTCEVSDKSLNKQATKTISFCSAAPSSSRFVSVYARGPRAEELLKDEQVTVTCLLVGLGLKHFAITWKVDGIEQRANINTTQPVSHSNGTETLQSFFKISAKDWDAFKQVSCAGKHICPSQSYEDHVRKNTVIYSEPSATLLQGSHELVCLATGFSPASINISWSVKNSRKPVYHTTEPHAATNGTFSIQSHLNLSHNVWLPGDTIICTVTHQNTTLSLNVTKPDMLGKCLFLDEILQADVYQDVSVDSWYPMVTFLLLFLTAVVYNVGVTMVKTK
ncbi:LOW QUALITY PROTEIN: uncharacterized protein LOC114860813 [Betta splendens]|uniref:LOW QUALITY PROTEIN: uncharacterized protein LOC114860813 n=1 Tax=Betta splendens TaxID=158456 RepID=A0A9W2XZ21_BETSP|nr:LOW QUALITY PROTEIN: uncharacterized protein LOC114860813 [Betta splendens]